MTGTMAPAFVRKSHSAIVILESLGTAPQDINASISTQQQRQLPEKTMPWQRACEDHKYSDKDDQLSIMMPF